MWVLYNNSGQVITNIPHGEIIRQGSDFSVYIAFEKTFFLEKIGQNSKLYSNLMLVNWINENIGVQIRIDEFPVQIPLAELKKFEKLKDTENICSFEESKEYIVFKFNVLREWNSNFGEKIITVRMSEIVTNENGTVTEHTVNISGQIPIYVEPTYGFNSQEVDITQEQIDFLLEGMQERLKLKLNISDEKVYYFKNVPFPNNEAFVDSCREHKSKNKTTNIYLGLILSEPAIGLVDNDGATTILTSTGKIVRIDRENEEANIKISKLESTDLKVHDTIEAANGRINSLTITYTLDCSNATLFVSTPSANTHAVNKRYVDEATDILHDRVDGIEAAQNLLDIVANKAKLNSWITDNEGSRLQVNDKIKVLEDETMSGAGTYYKWNGSSWVYIGKDGNYYTQTEVQEIKNNLQAQIDSLKALVNTLIASNVSYKEE